MRSRTYAYNGIILGILFGMAAGAYTESIPIGVIVAILGSVVCFLVIRFLENMLGKASIRRPMRWPINSQKEAKRMSLRPATWQTVFKLPCLLSQLPRKPVLFAQNVALR